MKRFRLKSRLAFLFLALCLLFVNPAAGWEDNVAAIAQKTDEHYNHLTTMKSRFIEIYVGPGTSRNESGILWLKKPGRMRWEYQAPRQKLFISDSHTAFFYVPGERQARKTAVKNLDDLRSPLRYLLGRTKLEKELAGLSLAPDIAPATPGNVVLRGVPKAIKDRVSDVVLEISPMHQITRIIIREVDNTTTEFRFSDIEENTPVQESLFHFVPPPGVELIPESQITQ